MVITSQNQLALIGNIIIHRRWTTLSENHLLSLNTNICQPKLSINNSCIWPNSHGIKQFLFQAVSVSHSNCTKLSFHNTVEWPMCSLTITYLNHCFLSRHNHTVLLQRIYWTSVSFHHIVIVPLFIFNTHSLDHCVLLQHIHYHWTMFPYFRFNMWWWIY